MECHDGDGPLFEHLRQQRLHHLLKQRHVQCGDQYDVQLWTPSPFLLPMFRVCEDLWCWHEDRGDWQCLWRGDRLQSEDQLVGHLDRMGRHQKRGHSQCESVPSYLALLRWYSCRLCQSFQLRLWCVLGLGCVHALQDQRLQQLLPQELHPVLGDRSQCLRSQLLWDA